MNAVLLVEPDERLRGMLRQVLEADGYRVDEALHPLAVITSADAWLHAAHEFEPDIPVIVTIPAARIDDGILAVRRGAHAFLPLPLDPGYLKLLLRRLVADRECIDENRFLKSELRESLAFPRILGASPVLAEPMRRIRALAPGDTPVLLLGERGTGRKLFARALHHLSPRWRESFVSVDCSGPSTEWTSRLPFAKRGTLFVERAERIDAADPEAQSLLLAIVAQRSTRVVASAEREVPWLGAVAVPVPPLRERDGDIGLLAGHFAKSRLSAESLEALRAHAWPGNVRELQSCIERALLLAEGHAIEPKHLGLSHRPAAVR